MNFIAESVKQNQTAHYVVWSFSTLLAAQSLIIFRETSSIII